MKNLNIRPLSHFWSVYTSFVYKNCTSYEAERTSVTYWKDRLFASTVVYFIPLSMLALIPSVFLSIKNNILGILLADFISLAVILGVAFLPNITIHVRKILFNGSLYVISIVLFSFLGNNGPGMLYLLSVTIFVVLSMDKVYGYIVFGLNTLICVLFAFFIHFNMDTLVLATQYRLDVWIGVSSNLIFLSGTAVLLIPHLYEGLQSSFDEQSVLKAKLVESIDTIKKSEQKFKALVQDGFDLIAVMDAEANYKYIAPTAKSVLGLDPDELIGTHVFDKIHPEDYERIAESLASLTHKGQVNVDPFRFRNKEGNWQWIESTVTNMLDNPAVEGFVANSKDVTEQITYQKELEESLTEKETLLAEIHHRVKNNLAIITSMMELQAMESENHELQRSLRIAQQRIQTIATIHELLYSAESLSYIDFGENISKLARSIENIYSQDNTITLGVDVEYIPMNINQAIPCALLVNEVVTNAYKHAFNEQEKGHIEIKLWEKHDMISLKIADNGIGLNKNMHEETATSIGMTLINLLKQQLEADMEFTIQNGTQFELRFKKADFIGSSNGLM